MVLICVIAWKALNIHQTLLKLYIAEIQHHVFHQSPSSPSRSNICKHLCEVKSLVVEAGTWTWSSCSCRILGPSLTCSPQLAASMSRPRVTSEESLIQTLVEKICLFNYFKDKYQHMYYCIHQGKYEVRPWPRKLVLLSWADTIPSRVFFA